ncbi:MAG: ATP-binding protein [Micropruina sp.]|uniref:ATP-binding protein n=1 Tax=Micropruina sp. TaxID=2737536 RepID=UPI0039E5A531
MLLNGARQCGKSTLAAVLTQSLGAEWRSLDSATWRHAAANDPTEFVSGRAPMVIDEVQRVPELLLAIKETVDADPQPGRFLLTGSARLLGLKQLPDALPGRMETLELWPLSQGEIDKTPTEGFVDAVFAQGTDFVHTSTQARADYVARMTRGGFPEAVARTERRRQRFLDQYVSDLINRDVLQVAEIERVQDMRRLLRLLAARSGQLLVPGNLANSLTISAPTVRRYIDLLEEVFLIKRIPSWSRNLSRRTVGTPKLAFVDSGIASNLLGYDVAGLQRLDSPLGGLLEAFVAMELARQLTWSNERADLFHYRTKDQTEVDLVLENRQGKVIAIDVKAASTVRADDFRGINRLADDLGSDLVAGFVLYTGAATVPFGPRNRAVPIAALWEVSGSPHR